jgi:hypothetical protein
MVNEGGTRGWIVVVVSCIDDGIVEIAGIPGSDRIARCQAAAAADDGVLLACVLALDRPDNS